MKVALNTGEVAGLVETIAETMSAIESEDDPGELADTFAGMASTARVLAVVAEALSEQVGMILDAIA